MKLIIDCLEKNLFIKNKKKMQQGKLLKMGEKSQKWIGNYYEADFQKETMSNVLYVNKAMRKGNVTCVQKKCKAWN